MSAAEKFFSAEQPPEGVSEALLALWLDARGRWDDAHTAAQEAESREGDWVHAYLHRKEGDLPNARYWYSQAGRPPAEGSLQEEALAIATALLEG